MSEKISIKEAFTKIKEILGFDIQPVVPAIPTAPVIPPVVAVQLQEVELKDGTKITVDKLEAGGVATIAGAPAPAADYEAMDGSIIKVGEGGIITEIVAAAPAEIPEAQMNQIPTPAPVPQYVTPQVVHQMEAQFKLEKDELKLSFETLKTEVENQKTLIGKQKEAIEEMFKVVQEMAALPAGDPVETPKLSFAQEQVEGRKDKMKVLADNMKKFAEKNNKQ